MTTIKPCNNCGKAVLDSKCDLLSNQLITLKPLEGKGSSRFAKDKKAGELDTNIYFTEVNLNEEDDRTPPYLITSQGHTLLNFRDYYWTDLKHTQNGSNPNQIFTKDYIKSIDPSLMVIEILKGLGINKSKFSDKEIDLINEWYEATKKYYGY